MHVEGTAQISEQLNVGGTTQLADSLSVAGPAQLDSTLQVQDNITARNNISVANNLGMSTQNPDARLHIDNTRSEQPTSLRIDDAANTEGPTLIVKQGRIGIGTADPQAALEVTGDSAIHGTLQVAQHTNIQRELTVEGRTELKDTLRVTHGTHLDGDLTVDADAYISEKLRVTEQVILGNNQHDDGTHINPSAQLYIDNTQNNEALRIKGKEGAGLVYREGKLGIGVDQPNAALDIAGDIHSTGTCLLYTSPSPRDLSTSRMPSSA